MSFNSRSSHFYTLNNHILQKVKQNPYLGILISEDLKWEPHLIKITKKANSTLAFLKRNLRHCPEPCRRTAYISLVRSVLEYGSIVWDPYYVKDINRIEKIQRQAVRFISGDYATREPGCISKMLKDQDLPSLQDRRMAARLTFFYKVVEGLVPAISPDAFLRPQRPKHQIHAKKFQGFDSKNIVEIHQSKNAKSFIVEQSNTVQYSSSFFIKTVRDWNSLEEGIVCAYSVEGFVSALHSRD